MATPDTPRLRNSALQLELLPDGRLTLTRLADGVRFTQEPLEGTVSAPCVVDQALSFDLTPPEGPTLRVRATLRDDRSFELSLEGAPDLPLARPLAYPPAWTPEPDDLAILPLGEGAAVRADDTSFTPYFRPDGAYTPINAPIALTALLRPNACLTTAILNPCDARLELGRNRDRLIVARPAFLPSKGHLAYARTVIVFLTDTLSQATQAYRAWRETQPGWIVTLRDKQTRTPELARLIGAADVWLWDDNNMNRLYGRPEQADITPREPLRAADDMLQRHMDRILWNAFEGETPEDCAELKRRGFLVGKYDIYRDVLPKDIADLAIPYRRRRSVNTPHWPGIVRINPDGSRALAWQIHGTDGQLHHQNAVCDVCALELTKTNVPPDIARVGYTSRLIDVQAGSCLFECYSPEHPATREDSLRHINDQNHFLAADLGLVVGVEVGQEGAARDFHYSEGLMSPVLFRAEDAGRRMCTIYQDDDIPPQITQYMLNPACRVPLWELIYHDCTVSYWYWGDSSNCCPQLMPRRDLFNALYGLPPLYSLNMTQWDSLKDDIAASYHRATPVARLTGYSRMTDFDWLTPDRNVQQTRFDNGVAVIANFSPEPFIAPDGTAIAPETALVRDGDGQTFVIDCHTTSTAPHPAETRP